MTVVIPDGLQLSQLSNEPCGFELRIAEYVAKYSIFWNISHNWLDRIVTEYKNEDNMLPPPQLSIASWVVASLCTYVMFNIATGRDLKVFLKFYLSSIHNDDN